MTEQVKLTVFYPHPPEKVWQALTSRHVLNVWMMENDFKPRLGHQFRFTSNSLPSIKTIIHCEVIELDEPKRLAYTWQDEVTNEPSLVIWTLTPVEGGTQLQLKHLSTGYATTVIRDDTRGFGWNNHPGLFLYQETRLNGDCHISPTSLRYREIAAESNFLLDYRDSKEQWDYRLRKLTQALKRYC